MNILFSDPLYLQMTWVTLNCKSRFTNSKPCLRQQLDRQGKHNHHPSYLDFLYPPHSQGSMLTSSWPSRTSLPLRRPPPRSPRWRDPSLRSWGRSGSQTRLPSGLTSSAREQRQVSPLFGKVVNVYKWWPDHVLRLWRLMKLKNLPNWAFEQKIAKRILLIKVHF